MMLREGGVSQAVIPKTIITGNATRKGVKPLNNKSWNIFVSNQLLRILGTRVCAQIPK
jgi:hypothetical protein